MPFISLFQVNIIHHTILTSTNIKTHLKIEKVPLIVEYYFFLHKANMMFINIEAWIKRLQIWLMKFLMCPYLLFYCLERWRDQSTLLWVWLLQFFLKGFDVLIVTHSGQIRSWVEWLFWTVGGKVALWVWIDIRDGEYRGNLLDSKWFQMLRKGWHDLP